MEAESASAELGQLIEFDRGISYGIVQPGSPVSGGVPIVRVSDVRNGQISTANPLRVSKEIEVAYSRTRLRGGELLITIVGTVGETAIVPQSLAGWNVARAIAVVPVRGDVGAYWIQLALKSPLVRSRIDSRLNTTVQATLNLRDVAQLPIPLPPAPERERIMGVMGALEEKIELNRRMNETLEAMARTIFRDWFVDFGPTRAKAEGRAPYLAQEIWDLFPVTLDNEGKPDGWGNSSVGEEFNLIMGQSPPGETYNEAGTGLPFFQGRTDFGFRYPERRMFCTAPTRIAKEDDTLVSVRAPVGDVNMAWERCCIGRGVAAVRHKSGARGYTHYTLRMLQPDLAAFEHTGTVFGAINKAQFEALEVVVPAIRLITIFEETVAPLDECIRSNEAEISTLIHTRDLLLPKLMSGEIRVKDAEKIMAEVA